MTKVYIGGSLFTDKQIKQRMEESRKIREIIADVDIYNPIENDEINDKTQKPTAKDIFNQDTRKIIASDIITADLDDTDEGLAAEIGIAYMANYMRDRIKECLESDSPIVAINKLLADVPEKTVYATCSDIRQDGEDEKGIYKSWGVNQFLVGCCEESGSIHRHFDDVIEVMKEGE